MSQCHASCEIMNASVVSSLTNGKDAWIKLLHWVFQSLNKSLNSMTRLSPRSYSCQTKSADGSSLQQDNIHQSLICPRIYRTLFGDRLGPGRTDSGALDRTPTWSWRRSLIRLPYGVVWWLAHFFEMGTSRLGSVAGPGCSHKWREDSIGTLLAR